MTKAELLSSGKIGKMIRISSSLKLVEGKTLTFFHLHFKQLFSADATVHRGSGSICWVSLRDLAIDMHFFGVIGFL